MGIESENQKIESSIKDIARNLLKEKKVDVIIGYEKGTLPLNSQPIIIDKEEDVDKLIWNNVCYVNIARYLVPRVPKLIDPEKALSSSTESESDDSSRSIKTIVSKTSFAPCNSASPRTDCFTI